MSPDIAIDRVRSFVRWNGGRFDALDVEHEAIVDPVGWRRRQGEKREYWIKPKVWREEIFDGDEEQALAAGQALKEADLLRVQSKFADQRLPDHPFFDKPSLKLSRKALFFATSISNPTIASTI